jgi:Holliday junction resolvasome RuvABC DNA-binding subunit
MSAEDLASAIAGGSMELYNHCAGIGNKMAGRRILVRKDKIAAGHPAVHCYAAEGRATTMCGALLSLGYSASEAFRAVPLAAR